ncbi:glycosyltransferase [Candidatus Saccharibacteria bacterium]|nr:glycosyltransferase [Candidatus Saccharibacteria bacterium]
MNDVLVSVICTNYNKGEWIAEAIESFLRQETDFRYEIVLIDDCSTDQSRDIVKKYAKKYPNKIRAFYNKENLGITKTWKKICKEARGKYIARCDGDDYWVDDLKLSKQVALLAKNKNSLWCTTDGNTVNPDGTIVQRAVFESGTTKRSTSYADMLATKGFTMPSAWLVDAKLMQQINAEMSDTAVDDTFNIQLDLFQKTTLTYLPDVTVSYRVNEGSDSRPTDSEAVKARDVRLLETQLEYIDKYKDVSYREIIEHLLRHYIDNDERLRLLQRQHELITSQEKMLVDKDTILQQQHESLRKKDDEISDIINSKRYKIGKVAVQPISTIRSLLKRRE